MSTREFVDISLPGPVDMRTNSSDKVPLANAIDHHVAADSTDDKIALDRTNTKRFEAFCIYSKKVRRPPSLEQVSGTRFTPR
jgi:hypothetical protein